MEWVKDYWYIILLGLIGAMFLFGYRSKGRQEGKEQGLQHETHTREKNHKDSHGCCR